MYVWAKFQSVYLTALPRKSPENSFKARGHLGQQKRSRLAAVQNTVANSENSPLHQKEKNEIHEACWPLQWLGLSLFTWSGMLNIPLWLLQSEMPPRAAVWNAEPRSCAWDSQFIGVSCAFWGQVKWHFLSSEKGQSAVQRFVPLAGASMSKILKLVIFRTVPSAVQACSSPTPILIKFIGSDYKLG